MVAKVLQRPTLVLNRNWQPVNVATVARCAGAAVERVRPRGRSARLSALHLGRLVELRPRDDEPFIQAVRFRLRVPEVVALSGYDRLPMAAVTFSRRNIFKRDHYTCQYCGAQPGSEELTLDHVVPRSQGGVSSWENCVLACMACNKRKADRTPEQARMRLRKQPVRPTWRPLYASHSVRIDSWSKFVSEAYWNVDAARVVVTLKAPGRKAGGRYRSVLLGEQAVSKAVARGSTPCTPACRRGRTSEAAVL